jgi:hypothetical protein
MLCYYLFHTTGNIHPISESLGLDTIISVRADRSQLELEGAFWLAKVIGVTRANVRVHWYFQQQHSRKYLLSDSVDLIPLESILTFNVILEADRLTNECLEEIEIKLRN